MLKKMCLAETISAVSPDIKTEPVLISAMLILNLSVFAAWPLTVLAAAVLALTIVSGVDYFVRNASVLAEK